MSLSTPIPDHWHRIAGIHATEAGDVAGVWLAYERDVDRVTLYDSAFYRNQPLAVIADGINAHGRYIPISWEVHSKAIVEALSERGATVIEEKEAVREDAAVAEVLAAEIKNRMISDRFKVSERCSEWLAEYRTHYRDNAEVPRDSHPLMAATRYAIARLNRGVPARIRRMTKEHYTKIAMV